MPTTEVVLATRNAHKVVELGRMIDAAGLDIRVVGLDGWPDAPDVAETESTFVGNAALKARAIAAHTGRVAIADDSGLCVDALNGMPGVLSARWAGRHGDDRANLELVLAQLADVPDDRRGAQFVCAAVAVWPTGREVSAEGVMPGRIIEAPRGRNGFGYDPIFVPDGMTVTSAELAPADKDAISHRGRAMVVLLAQLAALG